MKTCDYCGRENQDDAVYCSGCGTNQLKPDAPAEMQKLDESEEFVTLVTCEKLVEADLVVSRLDSAGIESFIPDENLMQVIGYNLNTYGYVRVQVRRKDLASAKELLSNSEDAAL